MTDVAVIIPARYQSSRYPAKPLALLTGATGTPKPLIQRSWECAATIADPASVWVATDDERIAEAVRGFGGQVVMTAEACANGTERCADAIARLSIEPDIVVNLQGDAPLTPAHVVTALVDSLRAAPDMAMTTPAIRCAQTTYAHLVEDQAQGRVGGTTVVFGADRRALYFSKRVIPHLPPEAASQPFPPVHLHLGVYAYRPDALRRYVALGMSELEQLEGLEQLRFLAGGVPVGVVPFDPIGWDAIELNNPTDVAPIEAILKARGIE
ncbi:3-deoxy-manno-octulosonate cytidylyltransferase [Rhizorhabdus dicambivorans]|uniref:3-deoxy-manno-octulosonate cytidylyltransferase n=1 Tax=Rhizorhabdus dicambivorans TaxID=1850238 RepID=A0A2A4FYP9_9SPHN|nr:manno-octulosonate cytidylyltransferase [Rhizorhabdus dicambivorans]ATE66603.1 3-deoxy-manno-octulosonate cytidylyltransferase [Rhizorhabdus dicambivorans]PCE43914.1 3-deoxy-manno-octulosonate cytidylyltransferase [Rhizorhabdus dicambivorans]